ncbi:LysR family transcriptional regulator [Legionella pneumophila]|uniref:Transcriptional regulator n=1 Tax=Legionella pneumophila subsp. pascullei TaxID=91890 RepID=A0AAX2ITN8_LEGPN|nr:LysR family transcriptional regulator [Legionella pneumophila]AMP88441.1 LysR family transcriptional regulator [Legionella pneumophila subsp. pascullei]AMP91350.1 LysR family transcriptional regulator [Legionella pneumophila subsp. pascullei]AMP94338.1 LysR family transcriptional regulator [Legionella pneumophila subsp. pascullei]SQG89130.1 transcriptional regulator [Legionella pneumophila subsp. pascullei]VEH04180.1 transcriptional regulator [Legionella pneumophila subsp. pascullei]
MSKFDRITYFIAVVEEHGFAAAARKIGVSTAAVSRQIARLEAELKAELLVRTTRKLSLTDIGARYYQQCKKALLELNEADIAIANSHNEAVGILNVTSSRYFAMRYLLPYLPEFMDLNPKLQIKIELAERFPDLAQESVDVLFGVSMEGPPELVRKRVSTTRYVLCASPDYLANNGIPKIPSDLAKHRYITHSMRNPDNLLTFKGDEQIYVEPVLWLNDSRALSECAMLGMGIIKLHEYIVAEALQDGRLIEILPEFRESNLSVYLYYQASRYLQPKIRRFIDFFAK